MRTFVKILYESAIKNDEFIMDAYNADGDTRPHWYSSTETKTIYATIYYGWLVGKYGSNWIKHI